MGSAATPVPAGMVPSRSLGRSMRASPGARPGPAAGRAQGRSVPGDGAREARPQARGSDARVQAIGCEDPEGPALRGASRDRRPRSRRLLARRVLAVVLARQAELLHLLVE